MKLRHIAREYAPITDGQSVRSIRVSRKVKLQKPPTVTVSAPRPIASAIGGIYGNELKPITQKQEFLDKTLGYEVERLRWMKPDGKGGLIPR